MNITFYPRWGVQHPERGVYEANPIENCPYDEMKMRVWCMENTSIHARKRELAAAHNIQLFQRKPPI